eukprot:CAMPEP_0194520564 /NCGR_PEP_ID=MMETSP0253-20130528/54586_1 /TAXON_ID=2966 /ORGANISM="Noctiluca scintillans" /LENGTH=553 /DNA_ID=CAMNT_0039364819 /DNA_START=28 /DNA_END=1687 /DNA_ORIENTATION=-
MKVFLLLLLLCSVCFAAFSAKAEGNGLARGGKVAVTQEMLDRARVIGVPILLAFLGGLRIPDQNLGTIQLRDITWHLQNEPVSSLQLQPPASIEVEVKGLQISAHMDVDLWFVSCGASASANGAALRMNVGAMATDAGTLTFSVTDVSVDLGSLALSMDNWGCSAVNTIVSWFLNEKDEIQNGLHSALGSLAGEFDSLINQWSYQVPTAFMGLTSPLDHATLDLHFCDVEVAKEVDTGNGYLQAGVTGEVRDARSPSEVTPLVAPSLPDLNSSQLLGHMVTAEIGNYTIDTAFYTFHQQGSLHYFIDASTWDSGTRDSFATNSTLWELLGFKWNSVFNGTKNMSLGLSASSVPHVQIVDRGLVLETDLDFTFMVDNSSEGEPENLVTAVVFSCPFGIQSDVLLNSSRGPISIAPFLHGNVTCNLTGKSSLIPFNYNTLLFLNEIVAPLMLPLLVGRINSVISNGIEVPSIQVATERGLLEVSFENASLVLGQGTATAGVDVRGALFSGAPRREIQSQWKRMATEFRRKVFRQVNGEDPSIELFLTPDRVKFEK